MCLFNTCRVDTFKLQTSQENFLKSKWTVVCLSRSFFNLKALTIKGLKVTQGAKAAIEAAGGKVED